MYKAWLLLVACVFYCYIPDVLSWSKDCEDGPLQRCHLKINNELIPGNRTHLLKICEELLQYRYCVLKNDFLTTDLCGWPLILKKAEPLIDELCYTDTLLRQNFLEVIPCVKTAIKNHEADCEAWVNKVFVVIKKYPEYEPKTFLEECVNGTFTAECYRLHVLGDCGEMAEKVYNKIVQRSSFYLVKCSFPNKHHLELTLMNYQHQSLEQELLAHIR